MIVILLPVIDTWVVILLVNAVDNIGILVMLMTKAILLAVMIVRVAALFIAQVGVTALLTATKYITLGNQIVLIGLIEAAVKAVVPLIKCGEPEPVIM